MSSFQLSGGCHHYLWQGCKFKPMLDTQGFWAMRVLYRAAPTATRGLGLYGLIRKTGTHVPQWDDQNIIKFLLTHLVWKMSSLLMGFVTPWFSAMKENSWIDLFEYSDLCVGAIWCWFPGVAETGKCFSCFCDSVVDIWCRVTVSCYFAAQVIK
jgi:hypothetical protein